MLWSWLKWLFFAPSYKIVCGISYSTVAAAAADAELQVNDLASQGWEAISIGVTCCIAPGAEGPSGRENDVVVLMRR